MKRLWTLLLLQPLLFAATSHASVYAQHHLQDSQAKAAPPKQEQFLVNAMQSQAILVKDKKVFQEKFRRMSEQFGGPSATAEAMLSEPHAFYCAGFVQDLYRQNGIWIPAHSVAQQAKYGVRIKDIDKTEPGDLVFFSRSPSDKAPVHVAVVLGEGNLLHASGDHRQVEVLAINNKLRQHFMFATRLVSSI
ncbi:C40 family peptidase [Effusibacillus lacus]|uniref:C40 family peptidase n=1 Tax=Effusibacillus lacus TaxID=1348429 RepID=UPI000BB7A5EB|nr:C40 family peptidase [Effusibacillus lacus]TCS70343.1 cell wall-associated NlpC family hydrolase [Effusibacillus lacus]